MIRSIIKEKFPHLDEHTAGGLPGERLANELKKRGLKQSVFAMDAGIYPSQLSEIIRGKKSITPNIAIKLENRLGIPAEYWLLLQIEFQLNRIKYGNDNSQLGAATAGENQ